MRKPLPAALFAVTMSALIGVSSCAWNTPLKALKPEQSRQRAPEFMLTDASGAQVKLADYKGKVVLLNFWATWCGPCQIEIPWFMDFEKTYKNRDFAVLGVSMDDDGWKSVKPY